MIGAARVESQGPRAVILGTADRRGFPDAAAIEAAATVIGSVTAWNALRLTFDGYVIDVEAEGTGAADVLDVLSVGQQLAFHSPSTVRAVGSAVSSSVSTLWTLVGLNLIPIAVIAVVAVLAVVGMPAAFKVWSVLTGGTLLLAGAAAVVVGVVAWVLLIRLALTVNVGTMLIVDEHMRTGDNRGAFTALGEGWHHSLRAFGATAAVMLVMAVPVLPLGLLASKSSSLGLVVSAALTLMWIGYVAVRGALVLPAVVLGDRSILGAMQESLELTAVAVAVAGASSPSGSSSRLAVAAEASVASSSRASVQG